MAKGLGRAAVEDITQLSVSERGGHQKCLTGMCAATVGGILAGIAAQSCTSFPVAACLTSSSAVYSPVVLIFNVAQ